MRKSFLALSLATAAVAVPAQAEYLYGFGGVYLDHQSWDHGPQAIEGAANRNQFVLGIEGGAGFSWGELYGFYDYESIEKSAEDRKASLKGQAHVYLGESGASLYAQVYNHDNSAQSEQNRVLGVGYTKLTGEDWWFKPWVGVHQVNAWSNFGSEFRYNGNNGYMAGWSAGYNFEAFGQNFALVNWNEIEFDRAEAYAEDQGSKTGLNGAAILFWHVTDNFSTALTYRYFQNKLGVKSEFNNGRDYGDALIYRVQYNF
ncbi:outer membrane protein OmpK [Vibrio nigripulchritudo]|uniref:outer membrane protein OmpK n=1 Tax=Vibrio nigripulchritudo TaxID=28173 RepID=UPI0024910CB1|nr:outer membrane protein OmpK [Vibrio nigripulchritudo]BDU38240.1 hypothetical protein TUMSATVNIG2_27090 [Vibrio nigripulchritudo]BDU43963.1 hypothetical protein TUMSATVNIG3_27610 [Vibrio nigripulchritudo]